MRPQHITAENDLVEIAPPSIREASMRPQHITAENEGVELMEVFNGVRLQ